VNGPASDAVSNGGRLPSPGPSFARAEPLRLRGAGGEIGAKISLGMAKPSIMDDGWWLTTLWAEDDDGVLEARAVAPTAGPPPAPPLAVLGPTLSGALMGLLDQDNGRQLIRLRMPPAEDEAQPWRRPLMLITAVKWDPIRSSTMRDNQLAGELMRAFRQSIDVAGAPGRGA
jgi:hypothetical protein